MWCLAIRDDVWRLLQANDLTIGKFAAIVDDRHAALQIALLARASIGLFDATAVDLYSHSVCAVEAAEEG